MEFRGVIEINGARMNLSHGEVVTLLSAFDPGAPTVDAEDVRAMNRELTALIAASIDDE